MSKKILEKKDKQMIVIIIVLGFILDMIIDNGMEILFLLLTSYACHRGIITIFKNSKEYKQYIFLDEESYNKGLKKFITVVDIYVVARIISIFMTKYNGFTIIEVLLVLVIFIPYESYLGRKYIKNIRDKEKYINRVLIKNNMLVYIILMILVGLTVFTFNTINKSKLTNHMKFGEYEYKLSYDKDDERVIEINAGSKYSRVEETERNTQYFDDYEINAKKIVTNYILKVYAFISMVIMFILVLTQCYNNNKQKTLSILSNVFLILAAIFAIIAFNPNLTYTEQDLSAYVNEYLK